MGSYLVSLFFLPWKSSSLHVIGQRDVVRPNIELPLPEPEDPTVDPTRVDADTHVHVDAGDLANKSVVEENNFIMKFQTHLIIVFYSTRTQDLFSSGRCSVFIYAVKVQYVTI